VLVSSSDEIYGLSRQVQTTSDLLTTYTIYSASVSLSVAALPGKLRSKVY
jgi:hypothetical protein